MSTGIEMLCASGNGKDKKYAMTSYPLSETMLGMFLEWNESRESSQYTIAVVNRWPKTVDADRLAKAVDAAVEAHEVFRMRFVEEEGEVRWTLDDNVEIKVARAEMSEEEADARERGFARGFDAFKGPFARFSVVETPKSVRLFTEIFHMVSDGTSLRNFFNDIERNYASELGVRSEELGVAKVKFSEYVEAEKAGFESAAYAEAREAAIARFAGRSMTEPEWGMGSKSEAGSVKNEGGAEYCKAEVTMPRWKVDEFCRGIGINVNLFFMGVFARTLGLYANTDKVVFATVNHGRGGEARWKQADGCCAKYVPVLGELKGDISCADYFKSFKLHKAGVYPFTHFCRELGMKGGCTLVYQEGTIDDRITLDGIASEFTTPMSGGATELPAVQVFGSAENFRLEAACAAGRFDGEFLREFLSRMVTIAGNFTQGRLNEIPVLSESETAAVMKMSYGGDLEYDGETTFLDLFKANVIMRPFATAVVASPSHLSYRELDERSDALAESLAARGVGTGDFVAVRLPRTIDFPVAVLAIMKCGAAYIPVDPAYPQERIDYIIADSGAKLVVDERIVGEISSTKDDKDSSPSHPLISSPSSPAYVIYTSGSTGRPKGVVVPHRALRNLIAWVTRDYGIVPGFKVATHPSFSFDASVIDIFPTLAAGGELHILEEEIRKDIPAIAEYVKANGIDGLTMSTQIGMAIINAYPELPLKYIQLGGEKLMPTTKTKIRIVNEYGPTEFCVCSSYESVDQSKDGDIPIGRAVANTYSFIVDKLGQLVPPGMPGEIVLAGPQIADGYWHQPEKTEKAFVELSNYRIFESSRNSESTNRRIDKSTISCRAYRTGDLARYNEEGKLEYLGRIDFQVKLRGFRIEIGEIEAVAKSFPGVGAVAAEVRAVGGAKHLVLYYEVGARSEKSGVEELKQHLSSKLTDYMVPDYFVEVEKMPMTPNGKIDRKALPEPKTDDEPIVAPEGETEAKLLDCVKAVVKREDFGVNHDFNDLGITSLGAMELVVKIKKVLGVKVTMRQLAEFPTVRKLAAGVMSESEREVKTGSGTKDDKENSRFYPLSENQRGIYVDWLRNPATTQYNIPGVVKFPGMDPETLAKAVEKVVAAHPTFRTRFVERGGEIVQEVSGKSEEGRTVEVVKLETEPTAEFFSQEVKPFAPGDQELARVRIFSCQSNSSRSTFTSYLFLDVHHIVFDGVSMGVFLNELMTVLDGGEPAGEERSAGEFAQEEKSYLESAECAECEAWFGKYLDDVESTRIEESKWEGDGKDRLPGAGRVERVLPAAAITEFCKANGVSPSDYLLTAFTELLKRIGRSEDVLVNFVSAGRTEPEIQNAIGMFVKTLPVRGIKGIETFGEAVKKLHLDVLDILDRSRVSYARLCEKFGVRPEILFVYEGGIFELPRGASLIELMPDTAKSPLSVVVNPGKDDFRIVFEYDRALYSAADMERLAGMFVTLAGRAFKDSKLDQTPLLSEEEIAAVMKMSYGGDLEYDEETTFLDLFKANVITRPFATAVVASPSHLSYRELDERSEALAESLAARGVGTGDFVAVKLPRTIDFPVAVLAIMKCGAAYIPVDPAYPQERIDYIVADSGAKLVVDERMVGEIGSTKGDKDSSSSHPLTSSPSSPAYVIYTSGSTGRPKGVVVPHRALRNLIAWVTRDYGIVPGFKVATHPSFSFDASVIDIFPTLAAGGELHILEEEIRKDIPAIAEYVKANGIDGLTMSTQIGMAIINAYPELPLRYIQLGGEKLMPTAKTKIRIVNEYGPTEFCVCSSYESVDQSKDGDIPIGKAVANTYSLIVDRYGHLLPQGAAGEIALAGPQIADGYWHQPEKTGKAFVELSNYRIFESSRNSESTNRRIDKSTISCRAYRTGDLARYNEEGKLEYLGRIDFQVKLRGFRIEIGEIEAVAKSFPGVGAVAAEVREVGGAKHLVLYYEAGARSEKLGVEELKQHLSSKLTDYMVPDYFVEVEKMPMTPNGKIDRRKLASPTAADSPREYIEPANEAERKIAKCYGEILKIERYGATDDFFELGGTSIVAIQAVIALQKAGLDVQYGDVFKYKTPRALAGRGELGARSEELEVKDDFGDYDYAGIAKLLENTRSELYGDFRKHSLGDVLLTGATGYLGMHVLRYLLEKTDSTVYALVRSKGRVGPERRIDSQYVYYFGERVPRCFRDRLVFLEGDITDDLTSATHHSSLITLNSLATVINCAALVKHYVADDVMERINVGGVENLIRLCEKCGARLVHTSTYSIGGMIRGDSAAVLDERRLFVGQNSDNEYIRTKFLAERAVLAATAEGRIRGKIMRLGNLMGRESDGEFQMNIGANAFINSLKSYAALGAYPLEELAKPLEMSPIDRVAEAICLLATTPDDLYVFHPYNRHALDMGAVIAALNARGFVIEPVSRADFAAHVDALRNDPARAAELQGILHYAGHFLENRKMTPVDNAWTTTVLYRLGFRWKPADDGYLANFFNMLEGLGAFEK